MVRMNDHSENIDSQAEDDVDLLDSIRKSLRHVGSRHAAPDLGAKTSRTNAPKGAGHRKGHSSKRLQSQRKK